MDNIIHHTMSASGILAQLELLGLSRSDDKRPDGMSVVPWGSGRPLVWDATCLDTFAVSYRGQATSGASHVAALPEERKAAKYSHLTPTYLFTPVAIRVFRCH